MIYVFSTITIPALMELVPGADIFAPSGTGLSKQPPFVVTIQPAHGEDGSVMSTLQNLEAEGYGIIPLPMPRNPVALAAAQVLALQAYIPNVKSGDGMAALLGYIHSAVPSAYFDPNLHCY